MLHITTTQQIDLNKKILIISGLSTGSVGTIALDLIIINNHFHRIGFLQTQTLAPSTGLLPSKIEKQMIGLPAQLYIKDDILLLQFRSNIRKGRKQQLVQQIKNFINKYNITEIIVVSSLSVGTRPDLELLSNKRNIYYTLNEAQSSFNVQHLKHIKQLLADQQEQDELIEQSSFAALCKKHLKNPIILLIFSGPIWDMKCGQQMARGLRNIIKKKEISENISELYD